MVPDWVCSVLPVIVVMATAVSQAFTLRAVVPVDSKLCTLCP